MINKRLTWFLESNNHILRFQSGFRSDHSTTDNLVRLETFIRDASIRKELIILLMTSVSVIAQKAWERLSVNYNKI